MSQQNYWRVKIKGGRKIHLVAFVEGQGVGALALCGQPLPNDKRTKPTPRTIEAPSGDECEECLYRSGYMERPKMTAEERGALNRLRALADAPGRLRALGLNDDQVKSTLESFLGLNPK